MMAKMGKTTFRMGPMRAGLARDGAGCRAQRPQSLPARLRAVATGALDLAGRARLVSAAFGRPGGLLIHLHSEKRDAMSEHHKALIYTMVLVSASDSNMTDREMTTIGEIVSHLPIFADYDLKKLTKDTEACAGL